MAGDIGGGMWSDPHFLSLSGSDYVGRPSLHLTPNTENGGRLFYLCEDSSWPVSFK